jgi:lysophospholipase L1-like esterase
MTVNRAVLVLAAGVVALLAAETGYRLYREKYSEQVPPGEIPFRTASPYTAFSRFEYPPERESRKEGEYRIFMTGGSTVHWGEPPLPERIEREFRSAGRHDVRVVNYGMVSHSSGQELAHIVHHISRLSPDMIVMYGGGNDIMHPLVFADPRPGYPYEFVVMEGNPVFRPVSDYPLIASMLYKSALARRVFKNFMQKELLYPPDRIKDLKAKAGFGSDAWREKIAELYVENIALAAGMSRHLGARFLAVFQPMVYFREPRHSEDPSPDEAWATHARDVRDRVLRRIGAARPGNNFEFVDFSGVFDGDAGPAFVDDIHLLPEANAAVARRLHDVLHEARQGGRFDKEAPLK